MGDSRLCEGGNFATADGKAHLLPVAPIVTDVPKGSFMLSTRRRSNFNTMVHIAKDPLTGALRDAFIVESDAKALGVRDGDRVVVRSPIGSMCARTHLSNLRPNVQAFFPEGDVLPGSERRDAGSACPNNAIVTSNRSDARRSARGICRRCRRQREALAGLTGIERRTHRTPGQYHLDLVADAAVLPILHEADVAVVSEESAWSRSR